MTINWAFISSVLLMSGTSFISSEENLIFWELLIRLAMLLLLVVFALTGRVQLMIWCMLLILYLSTLKCLFQ